MPQVSLSRLYLVHSLGTSGLKGWGDGLGDEGSGATKSANVLTHPPGLGEAPGPGTVRTGTSAISESFFVLFRGQLLPIWGTCEH